MLTRVWLACSGLARLCASKHVLESVGHGWLGLNGWRLEERRESRGWSWRLSQRGIFCGGSRRLGGAPRPFASLGFVPGSAHTTSSWKSTSPALQVPQAYGISRENAVDLAACAISNGCEYLLPSDTIYQITVWFYSRCDPCWLTPCTHQELSFPNAWLLLIALAGCRITPSSDCGQHSRYGCDISVAQI